MLKLGIVIGSVAVASMVVVPGGHSIASQQNGSEIDGLSSGSGSAGSIGDADEIAEPGYQIADVSGEQACGGEGFDYSRYWVGPMLGGNNTALNCVSGYHCEAQGSSPVFWCKQFALPLNAKCGGYMFYTLFKCVKGTACTIDKSSFQPRCLPIETAYTD